MEPEHGVGLLGLPGFLGGGLAEAAAAVHGTLGAGVPDLPPFLVGGVVLEAPGLPGLVDLGRDDLAAGPDQPDVGLLAAPQPRDDLVDDAVGEERGEGIVHPDRV